MTRKPITASLAVKLAATIFTVTALLLATFIWGLNVYTRSVLEIHGTEQLQEQSRLVVRMIESYDGALRQNADRLMNVFAARFAGRFTLDTAHSIRIGDQETPTLRDGANVINLDLAVVDAFTRQTGAVATVFARHGDDFVRITTSLQNDQGQRVIGTRLGREHPGYARLMAGESSSGKATLFGRDYMTKYQPLITDGQVIGILFIGVDFSAGLAALKQQIRSLKVGETGYFYVLDAKPGTTYGTLVVHPVKEGESVLDATDSNGRAFIREMLEGREGVIRYPWLNPELHETTPRIKIVAYDQYPGWDWVIGGGAYLDEFSRDAVTLRHVTLAASGLLLLAIGILLPLLMRRMISRPLLRVVEIFRRIGAGDYANPIDSARGDEIGTLLGALATMQHNLAERTSAEQQTANEMRRITSALDRASTSMMVADSAGRLIYLNASFIQMMHEAEADIRRDLPNFSADDLLGRGLADFHRHPEHQRDLVENLRKTYSAQMIVGGHSFRLVANPVLDHQGERLGTVIEWIDRTAEVTAERELDALLKAVARGDFSQRMSLEGKQGFFHEFAQGMNHLAGIVAGVLDDLATVLKALAQADLTKTIESNYQGRFADLKQDTNTTVERLQTLVRQIREATDAINTAAREIAAGNADLSERTEEQASSLEETASTIEEFNVSIQRTAENARLASELAHRANDRAIAGGDLVKRVVDTMGMIQTSSKSIADIISVIDGIAFQTNILALNAAVEAARAGEQGRGFAVVAAEVRNLAQRSAQAAKEIKGLIGDSVARVDAGARLVDETGQTMNAIVDSFQQVVGLVTGIADASQEQSEGVAQVTQSITRMDETTQRNAALVEQAAAAAESLEDQARELRATVAVFRMDCS
jgi:methyl-accepting chemotaxis protein